MNKVQPGDTENTTKPLAGAEFKLEKKMEDGKWKEITRLTKEADTKFTFKGLDDGQYKLTETKLQKALIQLSQ